jgi:hypothetical protein
MNLDTAYVKDRWLRPMRVTFVGFLPPDAMEYEQLGGFV